MKKIKKLMCLRNLENKQRVCNCSLLCEILAPSDVACNQGSLAGPTCIQDYQSLCAAATNWSTLVNPFTANPVKALHFAILV